MMQLGNLKEIFLHVSPLIEIENTIIYEIKYLQSKLEIMSITFIIILLEHGRNVIKQIKYVYEEYTFYIRQLSTYGS